MVRQALLVSPYDERLYRALLRATAAQGNRVGLRSAMAQLLTLAGEAVPAGGRARAPVRRRRWTASTRRRRPSTVTCWPGSPAAGGHPARL